MKGIYFLRKASTGKELSKYHIEAGIAYWHTIKSDTNEKWKSILQLYNKLLVMEYSPIAALNRTYALSKVKGKRAALIEAEKLDLSTNHFYFTLLGELYSGDDHEKAKENFRKAASLARTETEKQIIQKKIQEISI
jgi:RNA polymerase sigma-70 factor (ECF subfamily)